MKIDILLLFLLATITEQTRASAFFKRPRLDRLDRLDKTVNFGALSQDLVFTILDRLTVKEPAKIYSIVYSNSQLKILLRQYKYGEYSVIGTSEKVIDPVVNYEHSPLIPVITEFTTETCQQVRSMYISQSLYEELIEKKLEFPNLRSLYIHAVDTSQFDNSTSEMFLLDDQPSEQAIMKWFEYYQTVRKRHPLLSRLEMMELFPSLFFNIISLKNQSMINEMMQMDIDFELKDQFKRNAINLAVDYQLDWLVKDLISRKVTVNNEYNSYFIPDSNTFDFYCKGIVKLSNLHSALMSNKIELIQFLLENGANVDAIDSCDRSVVALAVEKNNIQALKLILLQNPNLNTKSRNGNTPLMKAIQKNFEEIAILLIDSGANVQIRNEQYQTPLIAASIQGSTLLVEKLIAKGSLLDASDVKRGSPLWYATLYSHSKVAIMLIDNGAMVDIIGRDQSTLLMIATRSRMCDLVAKIASKTRLLNSVDRNGDSALMIATRKQLYPCIDALLSVKADVGISNNQGLTAFDIAFETRDVSVLNLFLKQRSQ